VQGRIVEYGEIFHLEGIAEDLEGIEGRHEINSLLYAID